jgi:glycosyltransferase involved in cell wall biosynthesis
MSTIRAKHDRVRVAMICGAVDGAQWMVDLSSALIERGYDVIAVIAGDGGDTAARLRAEGVPFVSMPQNLVSSSLLARGVGRIPRVGRALRVPIDGIAFLATVCRMASLLRRLDVDLAHTQIFNSILIGRFAGALARVPIRVAMVPGPYHLEAPLTRRIDVGTQRLDHILIGGSRRIVELYRSFGVDSNRLEMVSYGADPRVFDPAKADPDRIRRELGVADWAPLVVHVAHFYPVVHGPLAPPALRGRGLKGHAELLAAARIVLESRPETIFVFVGRDWGERGESHRSEIEALAHSLGIAHAAVFTGPRSDVRDFLAAADVAVQCSLSENYGGTIESLLMRAPTVATAVGGMPETVRHEDTGLLVTVGNVPALAAAILRLIDDPDLGRELGSRGRQLMLDEFTAERMVEGVDRVYARLMSASER